MSEYKIVTIDLSHAELGAVLDLCAKELLRAIHHGYTDPVVATITKKVAAALAPESETNDKEKTPA
jgi:hypothetical protein